MNFKIKKNVILEHLTYVSKAINSRNIIPILNGIKFDLSKEGLTLTASDSNLTIKTFIKKDDIEELKNEGNIIIQSKFLIDIIKNIQSDIINFDVIDSLKVMIYSDNSEYTINCLNIDDYPQIEFNENKKFININQNNLKKMIKNTIFARSSQESRPVLTGLNIKINDKNMEFIATDSYRLAKEVLKLANPLENEINIIVPGENMIKLESILEDKEDKVEIHIVDNKILFKINELYFQSNLLNGTYPNTNNFIPNEFEHIITANLNDYYACISGASLLTQSKDRNIVRMEIKDDELFITSFASEIGSSQNRIIVSRNNKDNICISFSARYMLDALKTIEGDEIIIFLNKEDKPIILKSANNDNLTQLILPIRTY